MTDRVVVLLDMDCFYVQVEERDHSIIVGQPAAVVQYNAWKGGGIIAVNYEARDSGVKRGMRGDDAKEKCSNIHLITVPIQRGKSDLTKYRNAGSEVISVLCQFTDLIERASIDEAYIDLSKIVNERFENLHNKLVHQDLKSTWVVGYDNIDSPDTTVANTNNCLKSVRAWLQEVYKEDDDSEDEYSSFKEADLKLAIAAMICEEMRAKILESTGFKCSAGISHNKEKCINRTSIKSLIIHHAVKVICNYIRPGLWILGKLACGLHKPNQQTILPMRSVPGLWAKLPISKIRNLGGKLGDSLVDDLKCKTMGDLSHLTLTQLQSRYDEKTSNWLYSIAKGIDKEPVTARLLAKSIGCGKNFVGKESLNLKEKVYNWMKNLSDELSERLEEDKRKNQRLATTLTVHIRMDVEKSNTLSRSTSLHSYKTEVIAKIALSLIRHTNVAPSKSDSWIPSITNISLSAGKFRKLISGNANIRDLFSQANNASSSGINNSMNMTGEALNNNNTSQLDMFSDADLTCIDSTANRTDACSPSKEAREMADNASKFSVVEPKIIESKSDISEINRPESPVIVKQSTRASFFLNVMSSKSVDSACSQNKGTSNISYNSSTVGHEELNIAESNSTSTVSNEQEISSPREAPKSPVIVKKNTKNSFFLNYMASKGLVFNDDSIKSIVNQSNDQPIAIDPLHKCEQDNKKDDKGKNNSNFNANNFGTDSDSNDREFPVSDVEGNTDVDESDGNDSDIQIINAVINKQTSQNQSGRIDKAKNEKPIKSKKKNFESKTDHNCSTSKSIFGERDDESTSSININELFPDLSNIDQSVLALLPQNIQKEVARAVKVHKSQVNADSEEEIDTLAEDISNLYDNTSAENGCGSSRIRCKTCNAFVLSDMLLEHSDYHFAVNLRKEQMEETKKEILSHGKKTKEIPIQKSKRLKTDKKTKENPLQKNKRLKSDKKNICKMPKIDTFFHKTNTNS